MGIQLRLAIIFLFATYTSVAQHYEATLSEPDSSKIIIVQGLGDLFHKGSWGGHVRNYLMYTNHTGAFQTQHANAIGMKVDFRTARYKGFEMGITGIFSFDLFSSDLAKADPVSGKLPAFELQLFDVNDPENKYDLDRLEELFLTYHKGRSKVTFGRQEIQTPFVNRADGRMKAYAFQGITTDIRELKHTRIFGAWITHVSPRSTVNWYNLGESIGVYNQGVTPTGEIGTYRGHIQSKGLAICGLQYNPSRHLNLQGWYYHTSNVLSALFVQADWTQDFGEHNALYFGGQLLKGSRVGSGGNDEESFAYALPTDRNAAIGGRIGLRITNWDLSFNVLRLDDNGRFLFPREWGRENFYVTIPRGRIEGIGSASLLDLRLAHHFEHLSATVDLAFFNGPGVDQNALNKYGLPDYHQVNLDLVYTFEKWLKGLELGFLYVHKVAHEAAPAEAMYYQVGFNHYNFVTNFYF